VVRRYTPIAHRTAVLLGAGSDAEDVVQEAFVKAYRALATFRTGASFRPWLLRIVANETRNSYRTSSRRRAREHIADDPVLLAPMGDAADPAETALDLDEAETAAVLGIARGTVKSRGNRGLRSLRACWPAEDATEGGAADG
jgi:RNA polymerase sigma-70 factor (ECF subfamily)